MTADRASFRRAAWPLATVALAVRIVYLIAIPHGAVSNDLASGASSPLVPDALAHGINPYTTGILAWPPFWMLFLAGLDRVARLTGFEFTYVLRGFLIAVDTLNVVLTLFLASRYLDLKTARRAVLIGMALNPIELFLLCQHGNFDALVVTAVLCAAIALLRWRETSQAVDWLYAALALGVGVALKTVPLLLAPVLALRSSILNRRTRLLGLILLTGPAALGVAIIYVLTPDPVTRFVLHYRSYSGWFGISGILQIAHLERWSNVYAAIFPLIALVALSLITRWRWRADLEPQRLILLIGTMFAALIAFGPGYGAQYIAWPLPFLTITYGAFDREWNRDLMTAFAVALLTYVFEYGFAADLGQLFVLMTHSPALQRISEVLNDDEVKTLVRLPLFATYLWIVFAATKRLTRGSTPETQ